MRGTGIAHVHVHVYTARLVMRDVPWMSSPGTRILEIVGTVWGRLCSIPLRASFSGMIPPWFRPMCAHVRRCVLHGGEKYAKDQWFAAILKENGGYEYLSPVKGGTIVSRNGLDLEAEMVRMGIGGERVEISPLPPKTNEFNKSMVTLPRVVENLAISYVSDSKRISLLDIARLPSQSMDVHRMVVYGSESMVHMRDGFRRLWARSFDTHTCYCVQNGEIVGKVH